ncbi:MAG: shikimate dehydrogenase [Clostridiales bacterium]|nr:shikimate dehydrogenase [Clostridiales bacterium]
MIYGCIGERLTHSFSKEIHSMLFDYSYELCEVARDKLSEFMLRRDFKAINVTIPYKEAVIPYLYEISDVAKRIGAVNTIINKDGRLYGHNTDYFGLYSLIEKNKISLKNKKVMILGSGGTSRTALAVAEDMGCSEVYRVSRDKKEGCITYEQMREQHGDAQIIINTTPCGMFPNIGVSAISLEDYPNVCGVVDAVYNPLRSRLVGDAIKKGIPATGGLYMLVAQGARAASLFTGMDVPDTKIDEIYRKIFASKQNIVLIGMPSSGKSTVGNILARKLNMDFVDTDEEIVKAYSVSIPEMFAQRGEEYFRDAEAAVIKSVSALQGKVIATGGGAVLREENINLLKENGRVYFIDRPLEKLIATGDRPLSSNKSDMEKRYSERYSLYTGRCDVRINADEDACDVADKIAKDFFDEDISN